MFELTDREFALCVAYMNGETVYGFREIGIENEEFDQSVVDSLLSKGVLIERRGKVVMSSLGRLLFGVIAQPDAWLCIKSFDKTAKKQNAFYLKGETIAAVMSPQPDRNQVIWLPFLTTAVDAYALFFGDFMTAKTRYCETFEAVSAIDLSIVTRYAKMLEDRSAADIVSGCDIIFEITARDCVDENEKFDMFVFDKASFKVQCEIVGKALRFSVPNKEDCINAVTAWLTEAFSRTMKRRVELDN